MRVRNLLPERVWRERYDQINAFEKILTDNHVHILKFYLHIDADEQRSRFQDRINEPERHWKIAMADFENRPYWEQYMDAYEDAITKCSTEYAPWYVIPSNRKWFRNLAVSQIIVETLESLDMRFPEPSVDVSKIVLE